MRKSGRALGFALVLVGCAESSPLGPSAALPRPPEEDEVLSLVPAEADLVLWADLAKLRASPWTRESLAKVAATDPAATAAGLDLMRDVERVAFARVPTLADDASILVARGAIRREVVIKTFSPDAATASSYRGADLFTRGQESLALLGNRIAISGMTIAVRAALDCNFGVARAVESEAWFRRLSAEIGRGFPSTVAALYVHLQPATRAALVREMGEGGSLEDFAARVDLGDDLDVGAWGVVRSEAEARDLAGRIGEHLRDVRVRPIVVAFGFGGVIDALQLGAKGTVVSAKLHVSRNERDQIAARMAATAEIIVKLRNRAEAPRP